MTKRKIQIAHRQFTDQATILNKQLTEGNKILREKVANLEEQINKLKKENSGLNQELAKQKEKNKSLEQKLSVQTRHNETNNALIEKNDNLIKTLQSELDSLKKDYLLLTQTNKNYNTQIIDLKTKNEKFTAFFATQFENFNKASKDIEIKLLKEFKEFNIDFDKFTEIEKYQLGKLYEENKIFTGYYLYANSFSNDVIKLFNSVGHKSHPIIEGFTVIDNNPTGALNPNNVKQALNNNKGLE